MVDHHYANARYAQFIELLQRALHVNNLQEDLHYRALHICAAIGDRARFIRQYQDLRDKESVMTPPQTPIFRYEHILQSIMPN